MGFGWGLVQLVQRYSKSAGQPKNFDRPYVAVRYVPVPEAKPAQDVHGKMSEEQAAAAEPIPEGKEPITLRVRDQVSKTFENGQIFCRRMVVVGRREVTTAPPPWDRTRRIIVSGAAGGWMDGRTCLMEHPSIMCIRQSIYLSIFCGREETTFLTCITSVPHIHGVPLPSFVHDS